MSDTSKQTVHLSPWLGGSIITLLVLQVGLLWIHGNMLQRQHEAILDLREDVQSLAETLEEDQGEGDAGVEGAPAPAHLRLARHGRPRLLRTAYLQRDSEDDQGAQKELEHSKQSAQEGVAKARDLQEKLSISANIRKADEKAAVAAEGRKMRPWLWAGAGLAVLAMLARSWMRKRG